MHKRNNQKDSLREALSSARTAKEFFKLIQNSLSPRLEEELLVTTYFLSKENKNLVFCKMAWWVINRELIQCNPKPVDDLANVLIRRFADDEELALNLRSINGKTTWQIPSILG